MIYALALIVIICFVLGISFLYQGFKNLPQIGSAKAVSPEEQQKSDTELKTAKDEAQKLLTQLAELTKQHEATKGKLSWAEENVKALEETALENAKDGKKAEILENDFNFLIGKADSQARESYDVITRLASEIDQLKVELAKPVVPTVNPEELTKLTDENQKFKIQVEGYVNKVKELETLTSEFKNLKAENETLKKTQVEQSSLAVELQNKVAALEAENKTLKDTPPPVVALPAVDTVAEDEIKKLRLQNEEKVVQANAALTRLYSDMEVLNSRIAEKDERIKKLSEELLVVKPGPSIVTNWDQEKSDLQNRLADLEKMNHYLKDKEKVLTLKLVQARAQVMGLEKICEEYTSTP